VTGAKRNHRHVGICGEAPANYPDIARFLTQLGIDSISGQGAMVAIVIFSADQVLRRSLEQLLREDPVLTVIGVACDPTAMLRLIDQNHVDAALVDRPPREQLADWRGHDQAESRAARVIEAIGSFLMLFSLNGLLS
jgi:hypothetical protein